MLQACFFAQFFVTRFRAWTLELVVRGELVSDFSDPRFRRARQMALETRTADEERARDGIDAKPCADFAVLTT
jgi:hypothetical protein